MTSEPLVVTFSSGKYLPLLEPWLQQLNQLAIRRVKVFCLDSIAYSWCESKKVVATRVEWDGGWRDLCVQRIRIFNQLLAAGEEFIHSDLDAIWIKNALQFGSANKRAEDLIFSQGTDWPLDAHERWGFVLCCGWFWIKPTPAARRFFGALKVDDENGDDQIAVNRQLARLNVQWDSGRGGDYEVSINEGRAQINIPLLEQDRVMQCWVRPIVGRCATGSLSVALLPHREFQRLPDDAEHAVVKHHMISKEHLPEPIG